MNKKKKPQKPTPKKVVKVVKKPVPKTVIKANAKKAQIEANTALVLSQPIKKEPKKHYVNNKDLLTAILQYKKDARTAKREKLPPPRMPEYVGQALMLIAENLSHKPNFSNYTFREEMIGDAIENCCMYFDNFDPKKSKKPFAYFTQIIYYAFLRRIHREKKQLYTKYKLTEQMGVLGEGETEDDDSHKPQFEMYDNLSEFIENYETARSPKKKKPRGLEQFMEKDDVNPLDPNSIESDL
jgi:hypothetical protein